MSKSRRPDAPRSTGRLAVTPANDGEDLHLESYGQRWVVAWHPPPEPPPGQPHGANAWCVVDGNVVLISPDGERFGWPGGRPEDGESFVDTLHREVLEEVCARVVRERLLGYSRSVCVEGHEEGLVLVRAVWLADIELHEWRPRHEIRRRRVVPPQEIEAALWMEEGLERIYRRALEEAGLV